jgi:transposase
VLSGACRAWLEQRVRTAPFTLRGLVAELAARGVKTDRRAVRVFVHALDMSSKKAFRLRSAPGLTLSASASVGRRAMAGLPRPA